MTALIDTLFQLEKYLGIELDSLMPYAEADTIGGYHPDASQAKWGAGAIWDVEGRTLYALIRALKPQVIVEIGSGTGCSTTHMALALHNNFKADKELLTDGRSAGHITTIDRGNTPQVPDFLKPFVTITNVDAINWLALQPDASIDFILEDADHSEALCAAIGELAKTKLKPGGVLMAHDGAHFGVGKDVRAGYDLAGLDFRVYLTDPSDCGWLVWKRPQPVNTHLPEKYLQAVEAELPYTTKMDYTEDGGVTWKDEYTVQDTDMLQAQEEPNATVAPDATYTVYDEPVEPKFTKPKRTRKAKTAK